MRQGIEGVGEAGGEEVGAEEIDMVGIVEIRAVIRPGKGRIIEQGDMMAFAYPAVRIHAIRQGYAPV